MENKEMNKTKKATVECIVDANASLPYRGSTEAAGYDVKACIADQGSITIQPGESAMIHTGLKTAIPNGTFLAVFPRSGLAGKQGLAPANKVGVIDSDYRGEIMVCLHNHSKQSQTVHHGDRIAQLILLPYIEMEFTPVEKLPETERETGGFGSTGK